MTSSFHRISQIAALALIVTVATQLLYVSAGAFGITPNRNVVWGLEVVAFLIVGIFGLALVPARPVAGAAIALGGMLNVIQAGMGLVMFGPLGEGGDALGPVFQAVLAFAFLLYFAAKAAFAIAGVSLGRGLWKSASGPAKILGAAAIVTGAVSLVASTIMIFGGMQTSIGETGLLFPAGGIGTAATLFLAVILTASIDRAETPTSA